MKSSSIQTQKVADLAQLKFSQTEIDIFSKQLVKILDYIEILKKVKATNVKPTYNVSRQTNITQKNILKKQFTQKQALQNTRVSKNGFIVTKGVFENVRSSIS